jgi:hypothetical protein
VVLIIPPQNFKIKSPDPNPDLKTVLDRLRRPRRILGSISKFIHDFFQKKEDVVFCKIERLSFCRVSFRCRSFETASSLPASVATFVISIGTFSPTLKPASSLDFGDSAAICPTETL